MRRSTCATLLVLLCGALNGGAALRVRPPLGRRAVLAGAGASIAAPILPLAANAASIEEIAARSNAQAEAAAAAKKKKEEGSFLEDAGSSALNFVLTGATIGLVGFTATFLFGVKGDADANEGSRFTEDPGGNTPGGYKNIVDKK